MKGQTLAEALKSTFVLLVMVLCLVAGYLIFDKVMGNPINFEGGNREGHAVQGNYLGIIYRGGLIVPLLMAVNLILITFIIERYIMLWRAKGRGNLNSFVRSIRDLLNSDKIEEASKLCDKQRGSLANVLKAGLHRYSLKVSYSWLL